MMADDVDDSFKQPGAREACREGGVSRDQLAKSRRLVGFGFLTGKVTWTFRKVDARHAPLSLAATRLYQRILNG